VRGRRVSLAEVVGRVIGAAILVAIGAVLVAAGVQPDENYLTRLIALGGLMCFAAAWDTLRGV
jgi:hypothetical protein